MVHDEITDFIERWSDVVSLCIIASQLFVHFSVWFHFGYNQPVTIASIVCDKIFGDLVAIISLVYRCVAPFKEHGMWHFDAWRRVRDYFWSGMMLVDVAGIVLHVTPPRAPQKAIWRPTNGADGSA